MLVGLMLMFQKACRRGNHVPLFVDYVERLSSHVVRTACIERIDEQRSSMHMYEKTEDEK